jgi:DNA-binding CsgD family transcriptional regulator/PAS domain-containing protein
MGERGKQGDLIGDIYDAAVDVEAWGNISAVICKAIVGETAVSYISSNGHVSDVVEHNVAADALAPYGAYFHKVDPMLATIMRHRMWGEGAFGDALIPNREFAETEFYQDFAKGVGIFHMIACGVPIDAGRTFVTGAHRPAGAISFDPKDKARFDALLPHLQRMLQLRDRLGRIAMAETGFAALDALAIGTVICDAAGRILFANAAAEAVAGAGLILSGAGQGIGALQSDESKHLARLIAEAADGAGGGGMSITGRDGSVLFVLVTALPRRFADEPGRALVTLRPAAARPTFGEETLVHLFALTPAEARLALELLSGHSLGEIAVERNLSENTLRTQLTQVLRKTDTTSQRDLVRILSLLPPMR